MCDFNGYKNRRRMYYSSDKTCTMCAVREPSRTRKAEVYLEIQTFYGKIGKMSSGPWMLLLVIT